MSYQNKVRFELEIQNFPHILSRRAEVEAPSSPLLRKNSETTLTSDSFSSTTNACAAKPTNNNVLAQNSRKESEGRKANLMTLERKLRRQSFFEHICGNDASNLKSGANDDASNRNSCLNANNFGLPEKIERTSSNMLTSDTRKRTLSTNMLQEAEAMLANSRSSDLTQNQTGDKTDFLNFRIKKINLVKRGLAKFELVPRVDRPSTRTEKTLFDIDFQEITPGDSFGEEIIDLLNDLSQLDGDSIDVEQCS